MPLVMRESRPVDQAEDDDQPDHRAHHEAQVQRARGQAAQGFQAQARGDRQRRQGVQHQPRLDVDVRSERAQPHPAERDHRRRAQHPARCGARARRQTRPGQRHQRDQQREQRPNVCRIRARVLHTRDRRQQGHQRDLPGVRAVDQPGAPLAVPLLPDGVHAAALEGERVERVVVPQRVADQPRQEQQRRHSARDQPPAQQRTEAVAAAQPRDQQPQRGRDPQRGVFDAQRQPSGSADQRQPARFRLPGGPRRVPTLDGQQPGHHQAEQHQIDIGEGHFQPDRARDQHGDHRDPARRRAAIARRAAARRQQRQPADGPV